MMRKIRAITVCVGVFMAGGSFGDEIHHLETFPQGENTSHAKARKGPIDLEDAQLVIHFVNSGQGDCTLIESPSTRATATPADRGTAAE